MFNEDPIDTSLFKVEDNALVVLETEDLLVQGDYFFRYSAHFAEAPDRSFMQIEPFKVTILDPCEAPRGLSMPAALLGNGYVQEYTIETPAVEFTIPEFTPMPNWCEVSYTYEAEKALASAMIESFDEMTRTFTFEYSGDNAPLNNDPVLESVDYTVKVIATTGLSSQVTTTAQFILRAQNPCSDVAEIPLSQRPAWCPSETSFWIPIMPTWMKYLDDLTLYVGNSFEYNFGAPVNRYDEPLAVSLDLDKASQFSVYNPQRNSLTMRPMYSKDLGYWRIIVTASEFKNGETYSY